jgi:hypothetical protein
MVSDADTIVDCFTFGLRQRISPRYCQIRGPCARNETHSAVVGEYDIAIDIG